MNRRKKAPPPRPPPPDFTKFKSKSSVNLVVTDNLIQLSPPGSPKDSRRGFGGSVSSSFSSSTSSIASSKKSLELDQLWPLTTIQQPRPTIIRAQGSMPMPRLPPPSPPKAVGQVETPYGIALFDFPATQATDLPLQTDDVVILLRRISDEWLYGRVLDKEGMFPANFISIKVPLAADQTDDQLVTALYYFAAQQSGDLELRPGDRIKVLRKESDEWLFGECQSRRGVFPSNFVDRIPKNL